MSPTRAGSVPPTVPEHSTLVSSTTTPSSPSGGKNVGCCAKNVCSTSAAARLSQAVRGNSQLWREERPRGVLLALLNAANRIVNGGAPATITLYVVDPWLREVMSADSEDACQVLRPTTFYLSGKVTVHAYERNCPTRATPPRFKELSALPIIGVGPVFALPLQTRTGEPILAALQVVVRGESSSDSSKGWAGSGRMPKARTGADSPREGDEEGSGPSYLLDSQFSALQLLCTTCTGILDMQLRVEGVMAVRGRARDCLDITAEVHGASTLTDFEQRTKNLLMNFFKVTYVRVCFYDHEAGELVVAMNSAYGRTGGVDDKDENVRKSNTQAPLVGRRYLMRISARDGVVGRCVRKEQIYKVERIMTCPHVNEAADGVDLAGRSGDVNMLVGPMVANLSDETTQVMGVLQLMEKKQRTDADATIMRAAANTGAGPLPSAREAHNLARKSALKPSCEAFTAEDEHFFSELLKILGLAAFRTMQAQVLCDCSDLRRLNIGKLLEK